MGGTQLFGQNLLLHTIYSLQYGEKQHYHICIKHFIQHLVYLSSSCEAICVADC